MSLPATRQQFKDYCLRRLGAPVSDIEVSPEQIEDRIDDALAFYRDYHFDGTEHIMYKHTLTQTDKDNKYIIFPNNLRIMSVVRVLDMRCSWAIFC